MASNQLPFVEGASINRPPLFCGDNYAFWKVRIKIFMESVHRSIWQVVVTDYKVPTMLINGQEVEKPFEECDQTEIRRAENDAKALNIIHFTLNSDEFSGYQLVLQQRKHETSLKSLMKALLK
ncbi:hypothetical protein Fmac_010847 [Flemingia macrophylla]|uniref:DUF4219 domain-containing protein n=1 Tax=Flemingia macrophylla TaxID=520843 RepID=A0ABD1MKS1_9FABA